MIYYAIINCKENKLEFDHIKDLTSKGIKKKYVKEYKYNCKNTLASVKNQAIKDAINKNCSFIFLIENDLIIKDIKIFQKYIDLMLKYKFGVVYYGYYGNINRVLSGLPNPAVKVKLNNEEQFLVRMTSDTFIGIDLGINPHLFDEKFQMMEFNEYLKRCYTYKVLPFQGFYFDINNSYEYFDYVDGEPNVKKNITKENVEHDKNYINNNLNLILEYSSDATTILKYLKSIGV